MKEREVFEDLAIDGRVVLQWIIKKQDQKSWTGFIWLRTEISGEL
jgi:hypothetical protein